MSDVDWDSKLDGGQLCLYHKPTGDQIQACGDQVKACGEQATVVAPTGDTLVIFDSHMEHEVFPSFADRCPNLQTVSQHLPLIENSLAATATLPALQLSCCTVMHRLSSRVSLSQSLRAADNTANLSPSHCFDCCTPSLGKYSTPNTIKLQVIFLIQICVSPVPRHCLF